MARPPKNLDGYALALGGAVLLFGLWQPLPWPLAVLASAVWAFLASRSFGRFLRPEDDRPARGLFGGLGLLVSAGLLSGVAYFAYRLVPATIAFVVVAISALALLTEKRPTAESAPTKRLSGLAKLLAALVVLGDASLIGLSCLARTGSALRSPWEVLPWTIFVVFGLATAALAAFAHLTQDRRTLRLASLHFLTAFSVSASVYAVGFGFDPFIHRAAETALLRDGAIDPKQVLYAGQYVLVTALARLTSLPLKTIDVWLVPLLAAAVLPAAGYLGLKRGLEASEKTALVGSHAILAIPFLFLTFTVPFNLSAILFLALACLLPLAGRDWRSDGFFLALAVFILLCHPLLGAPALLLAALFISWNRWPRWRTVFAGPFALGFALVLPALFALNNWRHGEPPFIWDNPWSRLDYFLGLFRDPYVHGFFPIPLFWKTIYLYRTYVPPLLAAAAALAIALDPGLRRKLGPLLVFFGGTLAALFLLATCFVFKDVIDYEQTEFASRLLQVSYLLALPPLAAAFLPRLLSRDKVWPRRLALAAFSLAAALSWYFSYPQTNPKAIFSGPGVSQADVAAVREIERLAAGGTHVVLANQMLAAAALQELGFAHYLATPHGRLLWYPIPTGGALYPFFLSMNAVPGKDTARDAAVFAGTDAVFFAVHAYWPYAADIRRGAQGTADGIKDIGEGAIMLYEYSFR